MYRISGSGSGLPDIRPFLVSGSGSGQTVPNTGYLNRIVLGPFRQLVHPANRRHFVLHILSSSSIHGEYGPNYRLTRDTSRVVDDYTLCPKKASPPFLDVIVI